MLCSRYTAEQLNSQNGMEIALSFIEVSLDMETAGDMMIGGDVGQALRTSTNVRGN